MIGADDIICHNILEDSLPVLKNVNATYASRSNTSQTYQFKRFAQESALWLSNWPSSPSADKSTQFNNESIMNEK